MYAPPQKKDRTDSFDLLLAVVGSARRLASLRLLSLSCREPLPYELLLAALPASLHTLAVLRFPVGLVAGLAELPGLRSLEGYVDGKEDACVAAFDDFKAKRPDVCCSKFQSNDRARRLAEQRRRSPKWYDFY